MFTHTSVPKQPKPELHVSLLAALPSLPASDQTFAQSLCDGHVKYGGWSDKQIYWARKLIEKAAQAVKAAAVVGNDESKVNHLPVAPAPEVMQVGDLSKLAEMMTVASGHLKKPSIMLTVHLDHTGGFYNIKVKQAPKDAGGFIVTSDGSYPNKYYGKIDSNGVWHPKYNLPDVSKANIFKALKEFAADPVKVAGAYGHLHGHCCFCKKGLTDPKSTSVGYGPICAGHYGLPWGEVSAPANVLKLGKGMVAIDIANGESKVVGVIPHAQKTTPASWMKPAATEPALAPMMKAAAVSTTPVSTTPMPILTASEYEALTRKVEYLF